MQEQFTITDQQRETILQQIDSLNVLAISGGKVRRIPDGVELPVSHGYVVRVRLTPLDMYRVERVFKRGAKECLKGYRNDVFCDDVGEAAYYASCFRNDDGVWTYNNPQDSGPYRDEIAREKLQVPA